MDSCQITIVTTLRKYISAMEMAGMGFSQMFTKLGIVQKILKMSILRKAT